MWTIKFLPTNITSCTGFLCSRNCKIPTFYSTKYMVHLPPVLILYALEVVLFYQPAWDIVFICIYTQRSMPSDMLM